MTCRLNLHTLDINQSKIQSDECTRIVYVISHFSWRWLQCWKVCIVLLIYVHVWLLSYWAKWPHSAFSVRQIQPLSVRLVSEHVGDCVCLCVAQASATLSSHLCTLEMVCSVSKQACVSGWERRWWFLASNALIDGIIWVGRCLLMGGGWRLPPLIDPCLVVARGAPLLIKWTQIHPQIKYPPWLFMKKPDICIYRSGIECVLPFAGVCVPDGWGLSAEFTRGSSLSVLCLCVRVTLPQWSGSFLLFQCSEMYVFLLPCLHIMEVSFGKPWINIASLKRTWPNASSASRVDWIASADVGVLIQLCDAWTH